jgi:integrase/recombinase XerD
LAKEARRIDFSYKIKKEDLQLFIKHKASTTRGNWYKSYEKYIRAYLDALGWQVSFSGTLDHFTNLRPKYSSKTYRDNVLCIREFLRFQEIEWAAKIKLPKAKKMLPIIVKEDQLHTCLRLINEIDSAYEPLRIRRQRLKAFMVLGAVSGVRAHELYDLTPEQIDLKNRSIKLENTKTDEPRVVIFNSAAQQELKKLISMKPRLPLFPKRIIQKTFRSLKNKTGDLEAKHLRKFFSSKSDKLGMPSGVKKRLMGHSTTGDIDLQHYSALTFEDLKEIYDRYWGNIQIEIL